MISDQLRDELLAFRKERDWEQFHNLRTLSTSIALEAAELMEHTQWAKDADLPALAAEHRDALAEEMADIAILRTLHRAATRGTWPLTCAPACRRQVNLETAACLRQVNAPEAGDQRRQIPRGEGEGRGDEVGSVVGPTPRWRYCPPGYTDSDP